MQVIHKPYVREQKYIQIPGSKLPNDTYFLYCSGSPYDISKEYPYIFHHKDNQQRTIYKNGDIGAWRRAEILPHGTVMMYRQLPEGYEKCK